MTTSTASERVDAIRRSVDVIESGDRDRFEEVLRDVTHPEIEWTPLIGSGVEGTYRGHEGITAFYADFLGSFAVRYEDRELRPIGDNVVLLLCRMRVEGRESGVEVDQEMGAVYEFEGGLIRRGRAYPTHTEALAAAEESVRA
jgi:ketosteroid isomerase-like protein